jgi:hypothetical protein
VQYFSICSKHEIDGPNLAAPAMDNITHFVCKVCKRNSTCVVQRCRFTCKMPNFLTFLDSSSVTVFGIKYPSNFQKMFVHIISKEFENFPFFVEHSRFAHRCYFRLTERKISVTGSTSYVPFLPEVFYSWPKICDRYFASAPFNADPGATFPPAQKVSLPVVQHDLIIFLYLLVGQQFAITAVRITEFILVS